MKTLPDYLEPHLRLVSVGLNPSLPSVRDGFYFSGRRNRFWPALNASKLVASPLVPSVEAMDVLLQRDRIGFTDTVKRPTAGAGDLRAKDFRAAAPALLEKLIALDADTIWFHGKVAYRNFLRYSAIGDSENVPWGVQPVEIGSSRVYVTPNPSPANAAWSLDDLIEWFNALADTMPVA
ncbi:MAG: mismatch-specific DNA-glycosylase [Pseudomonadota bacterium]